MADKPVLLVVLPASVIGGAETRTFNLLRHLEAFRPVLLTQASIRDYYAASGIEVRSFEDYGCVDPYALSFKNTFRYARAIASVAEQCGAGIVLAFMHNGTLFASMARSLRFLRRPAVGTILGSISGYFEAERRAPSPWERLVIRQCTRGPVAGLIVPSEGVRSDLIHRHGAAPASVVTIPNGVDLERCRRLAQEGTSPLAADGRATIVTVCRFSPQKDFPTLLLAFRALLERRPARLVLVGDGELRDEVGSMARTLGIADHVELPGFQPNPYPYVAGADVFVLSSFYEGFGNVIVEAMALGIPVVATDCDYGPGEIIEEGRSGYLVPVGGWEIMADRLLTLLEDAQRYRQMRESGLARAERFGIGPMVSAFERYLSACLE